MENSMNETGYQPNFMQTDAMESSLQASDRNQQQWFVRSQSIPQHIQPSTSHSIQVSAHSNMMCQASPMDINHIATGAATVTALANEQQLAMFRGAAMFDPSSISLADPLRHSHSHIHHQQQQAQLSLSHTPTSNQLTVTPKPKRATGTTAARLLAEQFNKNRRTHGVQTEKMNGGSGLHKKRPRPPPKKNNCAECQALVPENQRDRHVLRYHLKKPIYACPLCDFTNNAEPSIVRTHLRLKHREFDLNPVNDRQKYVAELTPLMRKCFGPKKRHHKMANNPEKPKKLRVKKVKREQQPPELIPCKMCVAKTLVQSDHARIHAAQCHLRLPYLYGCPADQCHFGSYTSQQAVRNHCAKEHDMRDKKFHIKSEASKSRKDIKKMVIQCFGERIWNEENGTSATVGISIPETTDEGDMKMTAADQALHDSLNAVIDIVDDSVGAEHIDEQDAGHSFSSQKSDTILSSQ